MSELLFTNKSDLVAIADSIRAKTGINGSLSFPQGFVDGINGIGGQGGSSGSDSIVIDGMHKVTFFDSGEKTGLYYVKNNTGVQTPTDANGKMGKYTLTEGSSTAETFPYVVIKDLIFYKITVNIILPSPYAAYYIYTTDGNKYTLALTNTAGFRRSGYNLFGLFGATHLISKTFNSMDEAIAGLIELSNTQDISSYTKYSGNNYPSITNNAKNYDYYSSHVVTDMTNGGNFVEANPYTG